MSYTGEVQQSLPDAILEDIFLRLDDAADVVRASAACKSHRRVVCDHKFLRRYRFLHPPPVIGFLESMGNGRFHQAEPPHQSACAASSLVQASDFTFSFLPPMEVEPNSRRSRSRSSWCICDARDDRVLLSRRSADVNATFMDLVICDPLYRRYVQIPPIPEDLVLKRYSAEMKSEPFLLPAREEENESQFQVIYNWLSVYKIFAFLYSSQTGKWHLATSFSFLPDRLIHNPMNSMRYYVGSLFYWVRPLRANHILVLDLFEMKFSITSLPFEVGYMQGMVAIDHDAGVNTLGTIGLDGAGNLDLYSKIWKTNYGSAKEWKHDKHLTFPEDYTGYEVIGATEGHMLIIGLHNSLKTVQYFTLDPKTYLIERLCKLEHAVCEAALPYARFPPSLSPPSI